MTAVPRLTHWPTSRLLGGAQITSDLGPPGGARRAR
jgi:hypothetical protein